MRETIVSQPALAQLKYLTDREKAALSEFVARLQERYADEVMLVTLFGSKVRGDFDEESDLDLLVVVGGNDRWPYWRAITDLTSDLLLDYEVNMSALVFDEEHYQWLMEHRAPIYNSTTREGVLVWMKKRGELRDLDGKIAADLLADAEKFVARMERYLREVGATG